MNVRKFLDANPILYADANNFSVQNVREADASRKRKSVKLKPVKMVFDKTNWVPGRNGNLEPPDGVYIWHTE
jgi:hypothetical protein